VRVHSGVVYVNPPSAVAVIVNLYESAIYLFPEFNSTNGLLPDPPFGDYIVVFKAVFASVIVRVYVVGQSSDAVKKSKLAHGSSFVRKS